MYSLVMMAAFATGADATPAPAAVGASVVAGCCGGNVVASGCCGYSYGGCHGWGHGRKWYGHKHGCVSYGCCGFDYGPAYSYGYGSGCCGWSYSCHGWGGCYGSVYGSWSYGCGNLPPYGAYNIGGGGVIYSTPGAAPATVPPTAVPPASTTPGPVPVPPPPPAEKKDAANIKFVLPAAAKLYVDGRLTNGTGEERPFYTPSLQAGQKFYYDLKAELEVNGEKVVETKRVIVQAGDNLRETFPKLLAAAGKRPDSIVATK